MHNALAKKSVTLLAAETLRHVAETHVRKERLL